mmetsp:Transcript_14513/g.12320  ORF Transcript_14513/g.12320 Transcript_14513/m.12320 type:complete len:194 (-) Transcript_14513:97-678(-)
MLGIAGDIPKKFNKFLIKKQGDNPIPKLPANVKCETFTIDDTFLPASNDKTENRIRKRGQKGSYFYEQAILTYPRSLEQDDYQGDAVERKKQVTAREYLTLMESKDKERSTLEKVRQSFLWEGRYLFIDSFLNVKNPYSIIYLDASVEVSKLNFPEGIELEKDVTNEKQYTSFVVSKETDPSKKRSDFFGGEK